MTKARVEEIPLKPTNPRNKKAKPIPRRRAQTRKPRQPASKPIQAEPLSSLNLASIISGFANVRSTLQDLSQSIQRIEHIMDSTYRMFELAQQFLANRRGPRRSPFSFGQPGGFRNRPPSLPFPDGNRGAPGSSSPLGLLSNLDLGQLWNLLQSPLLQAFLRSFAKVNELPEPEDKRHQKQG
jgi:hypothetical protein